MEIRDFKRDQLNLIAKWDILIIARIMHLREACHVRMFLLNLNITPPEPAQGGLVIGLLPSPGILLVIVQECVVVFAFRYIFRSITLLGELIVDQTKFTPLFSGGDAVQTDVEFSTVVSVGILGVRIVLAKLISRRGLWALESIGSFIRASLALLPIRGLWPVADTAVLVKPEAGRAGVLLGSSIHTGVEDVTNSGVWVGVESIETGTQVTGALWRLEV